MPTRLKMKTTGKRGDGVLVAGAVQRIAEFWDLTNERLGQILGLSGSTVSRLRSGSWHFQSGTKSFELAQYLMRLFRSLDSLMGSDDVAARSWLANENLELGGKPIDLIRTIRGLSDVADYVDDYRARV
ncbi:MAG TPA: MbcA/ParS/Xre antitoxin family protein [Sphingomicrobium sp.]|nr:MbcA/ParS/Xre antitoxin family protein [Sphingomicrobium sp.]